MGMSIRVRIEVDIDGQSIRIDREPVTRNAIAEPEEIAAYLLTEAVNDVRRAMGSGGPASHPRRPPGGSGQTPGEGTR
jgi:hypothetical protein